jgi:hypothetical protein
LQEKVCRVDDTLLLLLLRWFVALWTANLNSYVAIVL